MVANFPMNAKPTPAPSALRDRRRVLLPWRRIFHCKWRRNAASNSLDLRISISNLASPQTESPQRIKTGLPGADRLNKPSVALCGTQY